MDRLMTLAKHAGQGQSALIELHNTLGGNKRKHEAFRKRILKMATAEEHSLYEYARSLEPHFGRGGFEMLLAIAARHT